MTHLTIIIPVLDEASIINVALDNLKPIIKKLPIEIIVSDGCSKASTINAINPISHKNIKKIQSKKGRASQMNAAAKIAKSKILLFLHADTKLSIDAGRQILDACKNENIAGGAFDLGIDSSSLVFRFIEKAASVRSRLTRIPYGDQAFFIKSGIFKKLKGFKNISLMEDIEFAQRLKKNNYKIEFINTKVYTSARRWKKQGIIFTTLRNICLSSLFYLGVSPEKLKKYY